MRNAEFLALIALEEEDAEEGEEERAAYAMMEMERGMGGGYMRDGDDGDDDGFGPDDVLGLESTSPPQPPAAPTMPLAPPVGLPMHGHLPHHLRMPLTPMHGYPGFDPSGFDPTDAEKLAAWNSQIYTALQWQAAQAQAHAHAQAALFSPGSAHHGSAPSFPALAFQQQRGLLSAGFAHHAPQGDDDSSSVAGTDPSSPHRPSSNAGTQTSFDELAAAAAFQQAQAHQTRAGRSASLSSFTAPSMRKHPSQGHVPQVGGVGGPFANTYTPCDCFPYGLAWLLPILLPSPTYPADAALYDARPPLISSDLLWDAFETPTDNLIQRPDWTSGPRTGIGSFPAVLTSGFTTSADFLPPSHFGLVAWPKDRTPLWVPDAEPRGKMFGRCRRNSTHPEAPAVAST
ncbi:hypothetical protein AG1IA_05379 [Rhizoctonia solani AG-1 IA]|uniref:Uncharacterized protein n=1 Tax=Thanatephorus cucumeris (strain AG1-IA) TaxID=983506 RepID=L8WR24_THACA|nr:hypothetical protein AG1IA_05379 [Rhizoctonia solani AG-1 IA]